MFERKGKNFIKVHFPGAMIGQEPWPLTRDEFYMNPSSTADQATAKLIAVKRTLPLDRLVKRNSKPIPPLLPQSFCPSSPPPLLLDALRFYFRVLEFQVAKRRGTPPTPSRRPKASPPRREQIKGFRSCRQVKKFLLVAFLRASLTLVSVRPPSCRVDVDSIKEW